MSNHPASIQPNHGPPLVLIVDDSVDVVRLLALILADTCDVIFAMNGAQGVELARQRVPDLILLDVEMPGMDGHEVWRLLRDSEATKRIEVLFVSAEDPRCRAHADPALAAAGWIRKPFSGQAVQAEVHARLTRGLSR